MDTVMNESVQIAITVLNIIYSYYFASFQERSTASITLSSTATPTIPSEQGDRRPSSQRLPTDSGILFVFDWGDYNNENGLRGQVYEEEEG